MTEKELDQHRADLQQLDIEQLRCGVMLQLHTIESLTADRDGWRQAHDEQVEKLLEISANRDEYQVEADGMAAAHKVERDALKHHLSNLLARIHRDGGHYEAKHGLEVAYVDADSLVVSIYRERDALQSAARLALETLNYVGYVPRADGSHPVEKAAAALKAVL